MFAATSSCCSVLASAAPVVVADRLRAFTLLAMGNSIELKGSSLSLPSSSSSCSSPSPPSPPVRLSPPPVAADATEESIGSRTDEDRLRALVRLLLLPPTEEPAEVMLQSPPLPRLRLRRSHRKSRRFRSWRSAVLPKGKGAQRILGKSVRSVTGAIFETQSRLGKQNRDDR